MLAHPVPLDASVRAHSRPVEQVGNGCASLPLGAQSRSVLFLGGPQLVDDHGFLSAIAVLVSLVMRSDLVLIGRGPGRGLLEELIENQCSALMLPPLPKGRLLSPAALARLGLKEPHRQQQAPDPLGGLGLVLQCSLCSNRLQAAQTLGHADGTTFIRVKGMIQLVRRQRPVQTLEQDGLALWI